MEHHRTHEPSTWNFKTRLPHCEIWQHSSTHAVAEAYPVQNYERTHTRINRNMPHLVNALGTVYDSRKHQNYLLVERIPNRLSQVTTLTEAQSLKVMYSVFKGLDELAQIYGIVGITESCICFNQNGKVKIWVNSDLSCVYPIFKQKQNGISSLSRIVSNIYQIISMIERKCFNSGFLKPFLKKLSENKIVSYNQAAQQILKIGQLLFVLVQEKPIYNNAKHTVKIEDNGTNKNGIQYQQMIQELKSLKSNRKDGHSRKFSDHHDIKKHRRYQSNLEQNNEKISSNQTPAIFTLNLNKFSESSTFDNSGSQAHKSAPITPRDDVPPEHKNSISFRTGNQQAPPQPPQASPYQPSTPTYGGSKAPVTFQKKPQKQQLTICCPFTTLQNSTIHNADHIMEQTSQFNDSFSIHLKNEEKDMQVSGQFQTFGMLEDSAQRCRKYGKARQAYQSENKVKKQVRQVKDQEISLDKKERYVQGEREFDAKEIQLQIQRRLQRRICDQKRLQIKARTSIYTQDFPQENKLYSRTDPQVFKTNTGRQHKLKTISYHDQGYKQVQPYPYVPSGSSHQIRNEKSPSLAYIDKKYEQYMRNNHLTRQSNQIKLENSRPVYTSPSRHTKQWSTFENMTNYEQPANKHSNQQPQPTQTNPNRSPAQKINKSAGTTAKGIKSCTNSHLNSNTDITPPIFSNPNSNTTSSSKFNNTERNRDRNNLYQNIGIGKMKENNFNFNFYQTDPRFQYRYRVETER